MIETIKTTDNMKFYKLFLLGIAIVLASCNASERVLYIQDMESGAEVAIPDNYIIRLKPMDQITVVVNSQDPELAVPFNTSTGLSSISGTPDSGSSNVNYLQIMTIDKEGYLDMPVIGKVKIAGLTRDEAESAIEKKIIDGGYIADPNVNVRFAELTLSIVGEVNSPGRFNINKDQLTIFEALALAKDMTIYGDRENVAVIREIDGKSVVTKLDLRSADVFNSPCYYLEQNDIIIVSPNKYRAASAEINQNRSFWISLASTGISLATLVMSIISFSR